LHAQSPALREKKNHMNHVFDTDDEEQSSTQLKFLKTLIDKLIKGRCSAILWDDNVLLQNTFSDDEKNEK
jgi:hypothetical protein